MTALLSLVAINTLLFLGLSVSKVAPWPEPLHPCILRDPGREVPGSPEVTGARHQACLRQQFLLGLVILMTRTGRHRRGQTGN